MPGRQQILGKLEILVVQFTPDSTRSPCHSWLKKKKNQIDRLGRASLKWASEFYVPRPSKQHAAAAVYCATDAEEAVIYLPAPYFFGLVDFNIHPVNWIPRFFRFVRWRTAFKSAIFVPYSVHRPAM